MLPGIRYEIETGNAAGVPTWEAIYVGAMEELGTRIRGATEALGG
jgi:hypothetical protein